MAERDADGFLIAPDGGITWQLRGLVIEKVLGVLLRLAVQLSDHQAERDRREAAVFMHEDQHRERLAGGLRENNSVDGAAAVGAGCFGVSNRHA